MAGSINLIKASDGTGNASMATVQATRSPGATTFTVDTVDNIPATFYGTMGTPHTFTDPITSETITVISEATAVDFKGHVSTTHLEIDSIAPGQTDLGSVAGDVIIIKPTTEWADNVADVLDEEHEDDGTHKSLTIAQPSTGQAASLTASGSDTNIALKLSGKGTGAVQMFVNGADQMGAWRAWTPTWTNVTLGNATVNAKYVQIGKTVFCRLYLTIGSTTSISGAVIFSLPVTTAAYDSELFTIGNGWATDTGVASYPVLINPLTTTTGRFNVSVASGTYTTFSTVTGTVPFTWGTGDTLSASFCYEAA